MQPIHFLVPEVSGESVRIEHWDFDHFYDPLHFHEECQLTYIIEGSGILFIGSAVSDFMAGDAFLIGKNIPHVLRNGEEYYFHNPLIHSRAITIFFKMDLFVPLFERISEANHINKLLQHSVYGIKILPEIANQLYAELIKLAKLTGFMKITFLLQMLDKIARSQSIKLISPTIIPTFSVIGELSKIRKVFEYLNNNSSGKITLKEVANVANMTPSAFCRFIKLRTGKTFSRFLVEIRVATVCRLIMAGKHNSSEACFESGFNNISNYHRHFKNVTGMCPSDYKKSIEYINLENALL